MDGQKKQGSSLQKTNQYQNFSNLEERGRGEEEGKEAGVLCRIQADLVRADDMCNIVAKCVVSCDVCESMRRVTRLWRETETAKTKRVR